MKPMKKIAFVVPWFGMSIPGGAEAACRDIARHLKADGLDVEILTTCIKEFASDWGQNYHKPGIETEDGMPVRRFRVLPRDRAAFDRVNYKLMRHMPVSRGEEETFFQEMIKCPGLYRYIADNKEDYHCFIYIPYMFSTAYYGVRVCPEKSMLIPCLHDESYAYLEGIKETFEAARGMVFLARAEGRLAARLYSIGDKKREVIGVGINNDFSFDAERFAAKYKRNRPFILYAGRKDAGKNVDTLILYFRAFLERHPECPLDLLLIGGGQIDIPGSCKDRIVDLGFVPIQDKYDAYGAAFALCQPSANESFSLVIMESWICRRPVLVNNKCEVTRDFCQESNGGLYFNDYYEFEGCLEYLLENKETADQMGILGSRFVEKNFIWDTVTARYRKFIEELYI
jgi:glycosyltransferase involved in cell wall biosynthesis